MKKSKFTEEQRLRPVHRRELAAWFSVEYLSIKKLRVRVEVGYHTSHRFLHSKDRFRSDGPTKMASANDSLGMQRCGTWRVAGNLTGEPNPESPVKNASCVGPYGGADR
jgi:hypothetical protein